MNSILEVCVHIFAMGLWGGISVWCMYIRHDVYDFEAVKHKLVCVTRNMDMAWELRSRYPTH